MGNHASFKIQVVQYIGQGLTESFQSAVPRKKHSRVGGRAPLLLLSTPAKGHGLLQLSPSQHSQEEHKNAICLSRPPFSMAGKGLVLHMLIVIVHDMQSAVCCNQSFCWARIKPAPFLLIECKPFGTFLSLISLRMRRKAIKAEELGEYNASSNLCQDEGMLRKRLGMRWSVISPPPHFLI